MTNNILNLKDCSYELIGDCYIQLTEENNFIEECHFEYNDFGTWNTLETLTDMSLKMLLAMNPKYCKLKHTIIPIPFFFTQSTQDYFPLLSHTLFRIRLQLNHLSPNVSLVYKATCLDTQERNIKLKCNYTIEKMYCASTIMQVEIQQASYAIPLKCNGLLRDCRRTR